MSVSHEPPRPTRIWGSPKAALFTLGANGLLSATAAAAALALSFSFLKGELADTLSETCNAVGSASTPALIVGALGFLPWVKASYARALKLSPTPQLVVAAQKGPVVSYFIPFVNFWRPCRAMLALDRSLDPNRVPDPPPEMSEAGALYRDPAPVVVPERRDTPAAPVQVWWTLWLLGGIVSIAVAAEPSWLAIAGYHALHGASAVLACIVVIRVQARLEEVERRQARLAPPPPLDSDPLKA